MFQKQEAEDFRSEEYTIPFYVNNDFEEIEVSFFNQVSYFKMWILRWYTKNSLKKLYIFNFNQTPKALGNMVRSY